MGRARRPITPLNEKSLRELLYVSELAQGDRAAHLISQAVLALDGRSGWRGHTHNDTSVTKGVVLHDATLHAIYKIMKSCQVSFK